MTLYARLLAGSALAAAILGLAACGEKAKLTVEQGIGAAPALPKPAKPLLPTIKVAEATGWPQGAMPTPAAGLTVQPFAGEFDHPRWLYMLPNGDILVAETNAPPKPEDNKGMRGFFQKIVMKRAGAVTESANRITLLRDADGDGRPELRTTFLKDLYSPFGMALVGDQFFVADADKVMRFPYQQGATSITAPGTKLVDLPGGPINHHWTKSLVASPDGSKLYVGVGSNSNVAENGISAEEGRAAVWEIDTATGAHREYGSGLRNPVGLAWEPATNVLWVAVNERDELGSDLVPDYMTGIRPGGFYGWPYSYYGQTVDARVKPQRADLVARAIKPDYALGPHTASLGLAISSPQTAAALPERWRSGAFVGQHGSWNRQPKSGYKVVYVPFAAGRPAGPPQDVLTGFLTADQKQARGRPVGVAFDRTGALLVADDVGNVIWRVTGAGGVAAPAVATTTPTGAPTTAR